MSPFYGRSPMSVNPSSQWLTFVLCGIGGLTHAGAQAACMTPSWIEVPPRFGAEASPTLAWSADASHDVYEIWAQWRIPEGAVLHTVELQQSTNRLTLPPLPAAMASASADRPVKLSVELRARCAADKTWSAPLKTWQLDKGTPSGCADVGDIEASAEAGTLSARWKGSQGDTYAVSLADGNGHILHKANPGESRLSISLPGGATAAGPWIIGVSRTCASGASSRTAYRLVP